MASLNEAKEVQQHLKPLRRVLDNLDKAISFAESVEQGAAENRGAVEAVTREVGELKRERDALKANVEAEASAHTTRVRQNQEDYERERDRTRVALAEAHQSMAQEQAKAAEKIKALDAEYNAKAADYRASIRDLEEQVGKLTAALDSLRRDVAHLVR